MERREFLKFAQLGLMAGAVSPVMGAGFLSTNEHVKDFLWLDKKTTKQEIITEVVPELVQKEDVILRGKEYQTFKKTLYRLRRIQKIVGYGHFNVLGFDEALYLARNQSAIGAFAQDELDLFEKLFYENASNYGFYGEKVLSSLTVNFNDKEMKKVPYTGHYLYRGRAEAMYKEIKKDVGDNVILTSGVRGVVKQMYLFLNKANSLEGNLSQASRSLAPPGYSYHGIGDFDVGKVGFGVKNFSSEFAETDLYKRLMDLGYIKIRYFEGNPYGVRFEPWHIKVM